MYIFCFPLKQHRFLFKMQIISILIIGIFLIIMFKFALDGKLIVILMYHYISDICLNFIIFNRFLIEKCFLLGIYCCIYFSLNETNSGFSLNDIIIKVK